MRKILIYLYTATVIFWIAIGKCNATVSRDSITISIDLVNSISCDTIFLEIFTHRWDTDKLQTYISTKDHSGLFVFNIPVNTQVGYWSAYIYDDNYSLGKTKVYRPISIPFLWEKGDNIQCIINNTPTKFGVKSFYKFTGKGSEKYTIKAELESSELTKSFQQHIETDTINFDDSFRYSNKVNTYANKRLSLLDTKKKYLSQTVYDALKSDLIFPNGRSFYSTTVKEFNKRFGKNMVEEKENAIGNYRKSVKSQDSLIYTDGFLYSRNGISFLYYRLKSIIDLEDTFNNSTDMYNSIIGTTDGKVRELLLTYYFRQPELPEQIDSIFVDAEQYFFTSEGKYKYEQLKGILKGSKLASKPYFLFDTNNDLFELNLADYKDKVVLVDFYYIGCGPCRHLYENTISKVKKHFEGNDIVLFIAISIDRKYDYWLEGVRTNQYTSISPNSVNLFAGNQGHKHPIFEENHINSFPMIALFKKGALLYFNTQNLYSDKALIEIIEESLY